MNIRKNHEKAHEFISALLGFKGQARMNYLLKQGFSVAFAENYLNMMSKVDIPTLFLLTVMYFDET